MILYSTLSFIDHVFDYLQKERRLEMISIPVNSLQRYSPVDDVTKSIRMYVSTAVVTINSYPASENKLYYDYK